MIVAGIMSGTSADGVDVALCRIAGTNATPRLKLIGHASFAYPKAVRETLLGLADAEVSLQSLAQLNWRLGSIYAECVQQTFKKLGTRADLIGCHGQTVYHQNHASKYMGKVVYATWQMGESAVIAERLRIPVVSDFRPADLAAGGQGAPLVPMFDFCMFGSRKVSRVLQNLGGIGNLTVIPAGATAEQVMAFDTGPGNMAIDLCMQQLYGKALDRNGAIAKCGRVLNTVVQHVLQNGYFKAPPPKSCGREQFGGSFVEQVIKRCRRASATDADVVATVTAITAETVLHAYRTFVWPHMGQAAPLARTEFVVSGGGAKNLTLMQMLREGLTPLGVTLRPMEDLGIPSQAKEAVAFALLAWLTFNHLPGNLPSATGATRPVILGKITHA